MERALFTAGGVALAIIWVELLRRAWLAGLFRLEKPEPREWPAVLLPATVLVYFIVSLVAAIIYGVARNGGVERAASLPMTDQLALSALTNALFVCLLPWLIERMEGPTLADLGLERGAQLGRDIRQGLLLCVILLPLIYGANYVVLQFWPVRPHPAEQTIRNEWSAESALLVILSGVILAPITEELLFRGVLLGCLTRLLKSWHGLAKRPTALAWVVNVCVSVLFALVHFEQWPAPVPLFIFSLGMGWLVVRSGRLGGPIAAHILFNGLSAAVIILTVAGQKTGSAPEKAPAPAAFAIPIPQPYGSVRQLTHFVTDCLTPEPDDLGSE